MAYKDYRDIFRQMEQLSDEVFRGFFDMPTGSGRFWQPPIDIYESETDLLVKIEVPGVRPDEMNVSLSEDDRVLTIAGMRREPEGERRGRLRCHQLEIYFGPFERAVALPQGVPGAPRRDQSRLPRGLSRSHAPEEHRDRATRPARDPDRDRRSARHRPSGAAPPFPEAGDDRAEIEEREPVESVS